MSSRDEFVEALLPFEQAALSFSGSELEYEPVLQELGPPWSYESLAAERLAIATHALDLGTGGGERLSRLLDDSGAPGSARVSATEWWHVNAPVAARRLAGRATVVRTSSLALPFAASSFDLVLSRHEEISPREVARTLEPGGRFLTQQVIPDVWHELREFFPEMARFPDFAVEYRDGLEAEGISIEAAESFRCPARFRELGHLVYQLAVSPWMIPGFGVRSHRDALEKLAVKAERDGGLLLTEGFFLLAGRKR